MRYFTQNDYTTNFEMEFSIFEWAESSALNSFIDFGIAPEFGDQLGHVDESYGALELVEMGKQRLLADGYAPDSYELTNFIADSVSGWTSTSPFVVDKPLFVDIPGDTSTTAILPINGSISDTLEVSGDQDWFQVTLVAGQRYSFALDGTGGSALSDPLVRILDSSGVELQMNDDGGAGLNSLLTFTATVSGLHYISAQAFSTQTGDYTLTSAELPPLAERDIDGIAHFLTDEFFTRQSYNAGGGGATTINFSFASGVNSLSAGAEILARQALAAWADVANINFVEGPGDIVFRNNGNGAFNSNTRTGSLVTSSDLNVNSTWNGGNLNLDSYTYQTFMHEIGHALGLGHAGPYNGSATYGIDNVYLNDSWAYTVMSYMDQNDGAYFGDFRFVLGPQIADIIAIQDLYGANTTVRGGDNVYGFNSTETDVYNFAQFTRAPSMSIYDTGGIDTLDFSGYSADQRIDLTPEAFSDVDNIRGVISIARGVIIENAIGGSGIDTITGNSASNVLTGNQGNDILDGGAGIDYAAYSGASLSDYTITDNMDGTYTVSDNVGTDGVDTLSNIEFIRIAGVDYPISGTPVTFLTPNNDSYTATAGDDNIDGLAGDDTISGLGGNDIIQGGAGIDTIFGGSGNDVIRGGDGNDVRLDGGSGNDTIFGDAGDDRMFGQLGDDTLHGGDGDDFMSGSNGIDIMNGDAGDDVMIGGNGNDIMDGGVGIDRVVGGAGDDIVNGGAGDFADRLFGQAGNDTLDGGDGDDFMTGELGNDTFTGGNGNDRLFGSAGTDNLSGGSGDDLLNGGTDNDRIDGGDGADSLTGGSGADIFAFDLGSAVTARDIVFDFATGVDHFEISGGLVYADLTFTPTPNGKHTTISYNGHEIYVKNTTVAELGASQFTFIPLAEILDDAKSSVSVVSEDDSFNFVDAALVSENVFDLDIFDDAQKQFAHDNDEVLLSQDMILEYYDFKGVDDGIVFNELYDIL